MNTATSQLALLLSAPQEGDTAYHHDLLAMTQALQTRGLPADHIFSLHGQLDRPLVLSFLQTARRQITGWQAGALFLHVSGHGFFQGDTAENARPGLLLKDTDDVTDEYHLFWDEVFAAFDLPPGVHLTLLPDL